MTHRTLGIIKALEASRVKFLVSQLTYFLKPATSRRNIRLLLRFLLILVVLVTVFSILFHVLMVFEGQEHSWLTGVYWTLTVMSTLGFGDITFTSDAGRAFSILVLLSRMIFLLILLPFTFIEFFYAPWMRPQAEARAPRELPKSTNGHIILTNLDPVSSALMQKLEHYGYPYALLVNELDEALRLHDLGFDVVLAESDRLSYASMGAIFNYLRRAGVVVIAEGLHLAETRVPNALDGMTLAQAAIPSQTGCNVVALRFETGMTINPDPSTILKSGAEIILIGTPESEQRFMELYGARTLRAEPIAPSGPGGKD